MPLAIGQGPSFSAYQLDAAYDEMFQEAARSRPQSCTGASRKYVSGRGNRGTDRLCGPSLARPLRCGEHSIPIECRLAGRTCGSGWQAFDDPCGVSTRLE